MKTIFSKSLANKLIAKGNTLIDIAVNKKNNKYVVFYFKETDKLLKDLTEITQHK